MYFTKMLTWVEHASVITVDDLNVDPAITGTKLGASLGKLQNFCCPQLSPRYLYSLTHSFAITSLVQWSASPPSLPPPPYLVLCPSPPTSVSPPQLQILGGVGNIHLFSAFFLQPSPFSCQVTERLVLELQRQPSRSTVYCSVSHPLPA